jgi:type 1 glutamine amidotransferase
MTHTRRLILLALTVLALLPGTVRAAPPKRVLVVTVTKGFRHADSIPVAEGVIQALGVASGRFTVDFVRTDDDMAKLMTAEALKSVDGIVFANTTGDLPLPDREAFLEFVRRGGALIGMHAAADTFHGWPAYISLLGGEFKTHGPQVSVHCLVTDPKHAATQRLGAAFDVFDEIYQFQSYDRKTFHELLVLAQHPNDKTPGYYPIAWCKQVGKGRVFYTALGHRPDVWQAPWYQEHVLGGILWALGKARGSATLPTQ